MPMNLLLVNLISNKKNTLIFLKKISIYSFVIENIRNSTTTIVIRILHEVITKEIPDQSFNKPKDKRTFFFYQCK